MKKYKILKSQNIKMKNKKKLHKIQYELEMIHLLIKQNKMQIILNKNTTIKMTK